MGGVGDSSGAGGVGVGQEGLSAPRTGGLICAQVIQDQDAIAEAACAVIIGIFREGDGFVHSTYGLMMCIANKGLFAGRARSHKKSAHPTLSSPTEETALL